MRKLSLALMVSICFLGISSAAGATSVNLIWLNSAGGAITEVSGGSITLEESAVATLTLDVQLDVDSRGAAAVFLTIDFDTDLENELNVLSWSEISWSLSNTKGVVVRTLTPISAGIDSTIESSGSQAGSVFVFDGTSLGPGPFNTTLTFARLVFVTSFARAPVDGDDIFAFGVFGGNEGGSTIGDVTFNGASVNGIPEPGTVTLLGLGVSAFALSARRRKWKH